jgi:hypothetical protein
MTESEDGNLPQEIEGTMNCKGPSEVTSELRAESIPSVRADKSKCDI